MSLREQRKLLPAYEYLKKSYYLKHSLSRFKLFIIDPAVVCKTVNTEL